MAILTNAPEGDADLWISWGTHVFRDKEGKSKGFFLEHYCAELLDRALENPRDDLFTALTRMEIQGRPLTREEQLGYLNIVFAGGRDTIIHSVACALGYLAEHPEALEFLRADPDRIVHASEEFFRAYMPLTHIGRVCPVDTDVHGMQVRAGDRATLCWASANLDEDVFAAADEVRLDRKPNPHVSFGFGAHLCLGAPHARTVLRTLLAGLCRRVERISLLSKQDRVEHTPAYDRQLGYESLNVRLVPLADGPV